VKTTAQKPIPPTTERPFRLEEPKVVDGRLHIKPTKRRQLIKQGEIVALYIGGKQLIDLDSVDAYVARCREAGSNRPLPKNLEQVWEAARKAREARRAAREPQAKQAKCALGREGVGVTRRSTIENGSHRLRCK
jgi:hypothetical protein